MDAYIALARAVICRALLDAAERAGTPSEGRPRFSLRRTDAEKQDAREFMTDESQTGDLYFWCLVGNLNVKYVAEIGRRMASTGWQQRQAEQVCHGLITALDPVVEPGEEIPYAI